MEESSEGTHRIVVRRRIPAPREVIYRAWIDPEGIREWMCPGDVISAEASLDVRVGGSYRIVMKRKDEVHEHKGIYQIVDPPAKLAFSWSGGDNPNAVTLVTVDFFALDDETELVITHERFTDPDLARRYEMGWGAIAGKFAAYLVDTTKPARCRGNSSLHAQSVSGSSESEVKPCFERTDDARERQ